MVATLIGQVETFGEKSVRRGKLFQVILSDGTGILTLTWFNGVRFMKKLFKVGDRLAIQDIMARRAMNTKTMKIMITLNLLQQYLI